MISSYRADYKPIIDYCRECGWHDDVIQKYLDYLDKITYKKGLASRGKTAWSDSQQSKVYKAEHWFRLKYSKQSTHPMEYFEDIEDVKRYAKKIVKSAAWRKIFNRPGTPECLVPIQCKNFKGNTAGQCSYTGGITLDRQSGMNEYVLIHEMVHNAGYMHHDASFVEALLKLISAFMGPDKAKELKKLFKIHKVKVKLPVIKAKGPDAWLVMFERLQKARKAKS